MKVGKIPNPTQKSVGNSRRTTGTSGQFKSAFLGEFHTPKSCTPLQNFCKRCGIIKLKMFLNSIKDNTTEQDRILTTARKEMDLVEKRIQYAPLPPMEEVSKVITKFIDLAKKLRDKGKSILDDNLM